MTRHPLTVSTSARDLVLIIDALADATIEAEAAAWGFQQKMHTIPELIAFDNVINNRLQKRSEAMRKALDTLYGIAWTARDEDNNYVNVFAENKEHTA